MNLRSLFAKFQNLNLIILIEDLKRGFVCREAWINNQLIMCPIQHGVRRNAGSALECLNEANKCFGAKEVLTFTTEWDAYLSRKILLDVLETIYNERLADADIVQGAINEMQDWGRTVTIEECPIAIPCPDCKRLIWAGWISGCFFSGYPAFDHLTLEGGKRSEN